MVPQLEKRLRCMLQVSYLVPEWTEDLRCFTLGLLPMYRCVPAPSVIVGGKWRGKSSWPGYASQVPGHSSFGPSQCMMCVLELCNFLRQSTFLILLRFLANTVLISNLSAVKHLSSLFGSFDVFFDTTCCYCRTFVGRLVERPVRAYCNQYL